MHRRQLCMFGPYVMGFAWINICLILTSNFLERCDRDKHHNDISQLFVPAEVTGKEMQLPMRPYDPGQGVPNQPHPAAAHATPSAPALFADTQGLPQQPLPASQQPPAGSQIIVPSRKRPKSLSPSPAVAQVFQPYPQYSSQIWWPITSDRSSWH